MKMQEEQQLTVAELIEKYQPTKRIKLEEPYQPIPFRTKWIKYDLPGTGLVTGLVLYETDMVYCIRIQKVDQVIVNECDPSRFEYPLKRQKRTVSRSRAYDPIVENYRICAAIALLNSVRLSRPNAKEYNPYGDVTLWIRSLEFLQQNQRNRSILYWELERIKQWIPVDARGAYKWLKNRYVNGHIFNAEVCAKHSPLRKMSKLQSIPALIALVSSVWFPRLGRYSVTRYVSVDLFRVLKPFLY